MESLAQFLIVVSVTMCKQSVFGHYGLDYPPESNEPNNELQDPQNERFFYNNKPDEEFYRELKFRVVGENTTQYDDYYLFDNYDFMTNWNFDNNKPTMMYSYGFTESYNSRSTQLVLESYLERGDYNIIVTEWQPYNTGNYLFEAIKNSYRVGEHFAIALNKLTIEDGLNLEDFYLVGHSLGGHLVGFIGRSLQNVSNNELIITRVTSLDPAGPLFYGPISYRFNEPLRASDAKFVDVIHTDYSLLGAPYESGTSDFWPNAGKSQPGCPMNFDIFDEDNFCSHRRSWRYYAESVRNPSKTFPAVKCESWTAFKKNNCTEGQVNWMGIYADPEQSGNFYLQTNSEEPFDRGTNGTHYVKSSKDLEDYEDDDDPTDSNSIFE